MAIQYKEIVPWGRSYEEYISMFNLSEKDLDKSILGCGDGPASFNTVMYQKGKKMISIDPIYSLTAEEIEKQIKATYQNVLIQTQQNKEKFIWNEIESVEELGQIRMSAMKSFLSDYEKGKVQNRYIPAELPNLPFENKQFDLVLCSHFLFLYTNNLTVDFHIQAINEMLRIANEVRIFPLMDVNSSRSIYVDEVLSRYTDLGYCAKEVQVNYEFQKGGNKMMVIF
ncbi:MAG: hypothetical protein K0S30_1452 [Clostridia bacterium]|jgi:hypothetical protein|nr:hypothetical protein [Clostridia bacterium]